MLYEITLLVLKLFNLKILIIISYNMLICKKCLEEKDESRFYFNKKRGRFQTSWCYDCKNKNRNEKYISKKKESCDFICIKCNLQKDQSRFFYNKKTKHYLKKCYDCKNNERNERRRIDYEFRQKERDRYKQWVEDKDRSEYNKEWSRNNRTRINNNKKNRQKNVIQCYLKESIRSRIADCLRNYIKGYYKKTKASLKYIGCDIETYIKWLEFNFVDDMSWLNRGNLWHIDHIIPCASFNLSNEDEMLKCFHWSNTFPLLKEKNLKKSNKIDNEYIAFTQNRVNKFLMLNNIQNC